MRDAGGGAPERARRRDLPRPPSRRAYVPPTRLPDQPRLRRELLLWYLGLNPTTKKENEKEPALFPDTAVVSLLGVEPLLPLLNRARRLAPLGFGARHISEASSGRRGPDLEAWRFGSSCEPVGAAVGISSRAYNFQVNYACR